MFTNVDDIQNWLYSKSIIDFTIDEKTLIVNVNEPVDLSLRNITSLPVRFGKVNGPFKINNNPLITLEGCPNTVCSFDCSNTKITTFIGGPIKLGSAPKFGHYVANNLTCIYDLAGLPREVTSLSLMGAVNLESYDHIPSKIHGDLTIIDNEELNIYDIDPLYVGGRIIMSDTHI